MNNMKESIFSFLTSYVPTDKRESREDYLTQMFAWMLINITGFAEAYVNFLCDKNKDIPKPTVFEFDISTQEVLSTGRIDLLIRVNSDMSFICEHKVFSELSENQIKKYMDNSSQLGGGKYYSVLLTYSRAQHTQDADVSIIWSDISEFVESIISSYEFEEAFMLGQFLSFLAENGMGKVEPIKPEALMGYWAGVNLSTNLDIIFSQLGNIDWKTECPGIDTFTTSEFNPTFNKMRWGRKGIDFHTSWKPGIFAGVLMRTEDHHLEPMNKYKGIDFVVFLESEYSKVDVEKVQIRKSIIGNEKYKSLVNKLSKDSGKFEFIPGLSKSPWRIAVLRRPLLDILFENPELSQHDTIKKAMIEGINLLLG